MKDEEFVFRQDVKEKATTARSARRKRTHTGKGGRVKFPSDNLTRKELNAMNGEVKSYKLNSPMTWGEFKNLPDDIKVIYIKALRQKYGVSDTKIGGMLGIKQAHMSREVRRIGLGVDKGQKKTTKFDKEGWNAWCNGITLPTLDNIDEIPEAEEHFPAELQAASNEDVSENAPVQEAHTEEKRKAIPNHGRMSFEGDVESILNTLAVLLGGANVQICITWDVLPEPPCGADMRGEEDG